MKQRKIKLLRQSQDLDLHELPKFSYSRKRREERGGGRKRRRRYWPFLRCVLARGAFEKLAPVYPSVFPGRWLDELRGWLLRNSLSLLFRRGKYLIPRPRGKTGYCQCWQRPGPAIPHRGGGMCVWALEAASIHTLLGNLISTKKLIWCISLISRSGLWKGEGASDIPFFLSWVCSIPIFDIFR